MKIDVMELSAQLDNVTDLVFGDDYEFIIKFQCTNCDTDSNKFISFCRNRVLPIISGKCHVNAVFKCKLCSRSCYISILECPYRPYSIEDSGTFKTVVEFNCRGCAPIFFKPMSGFKCKSNQSSQCFENVDLSDNNWADYDEEAMVSVGIYDLKYRFGSYRRR